jgi:hypothetical protein
MEKSLFCSMGLIERWAHNIGLRHWIETRMLKPVRTWSKLTATTSFDAELQKIAHRDAASYAYANFRKAIYFSSKKDMYDHVVQNLQGSAGLCTEFGVYKAATLNYFANKLPNRTWHGFDSFEGLPEAWSGSGQSKGAFSLGGKLPKVAPNVVLHKGWFSETAVAFFDQQKESLAFAHLDADLYTATLEALNAMTAKARAGSLLLFDEYFGQIAWREHEHKAFSEWLENNQLEAECLAWVSNGAVLFRLK